MRRPSTVRSAVAGAVALATGTALAGGVGATPEAVPASSAAEPTAAEAVQVTVTEGTNMTAAAAPDGSTIVDLQGLLFRVPEGGGTAEQLSEPELEPAQPDVGPDGRIAFQGYADGRFHVWVADADGSDPEQLTTGGFDDREPRWSPDGTKIAFSSDRGGTYDIWVLDVATGDLTQWTDAAGLEFEPTWHPDGDEIAYIADDHIAATDANGATRTVVERPADQQASVHAPSWGPDGERIAYVQRKGTEADLMVGGEAVTTGEDVFLFAPDWVADDELLYTADGKIRTVTTGGASSNIPFEATIGIPALAYEKKNHDFDDRTRKQVTGIVTPTLSPDASQIAFVALNDLWLMPVDGEPRRITDDNYHEVNPAWSADGRYLAYSSDKAGTEDIYIRDLRTGDERRATAMDGAEVSAAFSPDGDQLAFQNQAGATFVLDLDSGSVRELVPSLFGPGRPTWSADGSTIAFSAVKRYSERFREGTSQILTVDVATGEQQFQAPGEQHASISTRGDDGPVWSPDGDQMAFVVDSTLRVMPVDNTGSPTGPARQVNDEVADAPTWSGDSQSLLYLSNGKLRLADADTGEARTIEVPLTHKPDVATGRTVIHAGAMWDGESRELRHDVDIVVVGNRVKSIRPHTGAHPGNANVVDASGLTVMPGLMDSHVHQEYESRFYGDRQGRVSLAYGITSTMSVGDQVYRAMEDREALEAGERVGPRFYATGEPIDGSRVYYNFMRPTTSDEQVEKELSRARALDYDMLKTYVRLPADRMKTVTDAAHEMGLISNSHYLSPGAHLGQDGTTHLAATQRLGYARTLTATGASYSDVASLYGEGERSVTATLFSYDFLYQDEIANDPRLQLLPPWKQQSLLRNTAGNTAPPSDPQCESAACQEVQALGNIADAGGRVLGGTDSPLVEVGISLHANLREMVGYGWDEYDALRTATVNAAENLDVADQVGTIAPGKLADLTFVEGNPLEDINAAMDVNMTMAGGELYTQEELLAPFTTAGTTQGDDGARRQKSGDTPAPATRVNARADAKAANRYWWHAPEVVEAEYDHACDAYEDLNRWHDVDDGHGH
jgi:Tol biopolymer transport system component